MRPPRRAAGALARAPGARAGRAGRACQRRQPHRPPCARRWRKGLLINVASVSFPVDGLTLAAFSILTWAGSWSVVQHRVLFDVDDEAATWAAHSEYATALFPPPGWLHGWRGGA